MLWKHATGFLNLDRPRILGIVNVTPDSFSDGGTLASVDDGRRRIERLIQEGADIIDIGGESTRPQGATPVTVDEELRRVIPLITATLADFPETPVSVDTVKARVAREALQAGASIVNDVSGLRLDGEMAATCAQSGAGLVLMHSRGDVADMATFAHANYGADPAHDVIAELQLAIERARSAGVEDANIVVDPGIGFAKRGEHSLRILADLPRIGTLGFPMLIGVSRKRFIGQITGTERPSARAAGTAGANVAALHRGARLFRVHDVKTSRDALDVAWAIMQAGLQ